jgi:hypothetical protein
MSKEGGIMNIDKTAMLTGWFMGRKVAAMMLPQQKLVGYSYNGVVLPALPEWDKTAYPYALISSYDGDLSYRTLYLLDRVEYYYHDPDNLNRWSFSLPNGRVRASYNKSRAEWEDFEKQNYTVLNVYHNHFKWSNFDVLNEDGSVYIAASDPIPVYE